MPREFSRTDRVGQQLHQEIAIILQQELQHREPRLGMITVSGASVSRDLAYAKVFVTFFEQDQAKIKEQLKLLVDNAKFVRGLLAKRMRMRAVPELRFSVDGSITEGMRISNLVSEVRINDKQRAKASGRDVDSDGDNEE
jgi:ribosome-binding factor A